MVAQDYLKIVVDNLRLASQARKQEVDELRKSIAQNDQDFKDQNKELKLREALYLEQAAETNDDKEHASKLRTAQMQRVEESQIKSDFNKFKREADAALQAKQRNLDDINRVLQEVQNGWMSI